jgi:hypothetical protein
MVLSAVSSSYFSLSVSRSSFDEPGCKKDAAVGLAHCILYRLLILSMHNFSLVNPIGKNPAEMQQNQYARSFRLTRKKRPFVASEGRQWPLNLFPPMQAG